MTALLELRGVKKVFPQRSKHDLLVLNQCHLSVKEGEVLAILGKTGSGKSTLLRIISGLIRPTAGDVLYEGKRVEGIVPDMAMVFQHFALLPWLTVLRNVELGLASKALPSAKQRELALETIDMVGMDGFETAYPNELSGGMCQRVGLARALVANPNMLLMDEPFSALDVLTAENLRNDLLDLWQKGIMNLKSIIFVSHNIEEAVCLADRVIVISSNPGSIVADIPIDLPHPRIAERDTPFWDKVDEIYQCMSETSMQLGRMADGHLIGTTAQLPKVAVPELSGLIVCLHDQEYGDEGELSALAEDMHLETDELFALVDVLVILNFAKVTKSKVKLTFTGKSFADADLQKRKRLFANQLLTCVPLVRLIRSQLDSASDHCVHEDYFVAHLEKDMGEDAAQDVLKTVINWGRYAEVFAYHANDGILSLDNPA